MPYTTIDSSKIFYTDEGDGPETVLFIHGGTCDSHDWSAQIAPFTARHRVIAPDLAGHGRSADAAGSANPSRYADDRAPRARLEVAM
jgi:pimeloyl-ACP methyl ester carboxylesterase